MNRNAAADDGLRVARCASGGAGVRPPLREDGKVRNETVANLSHLPG